MSPALRVSVFQGRNTESGSNKGFFPCLPFCLLPFALLKILLTDSYLSQIILGFFTWDPGARSHPNAPFCLPAVVSVQDER